MCILCFGVAIILNKASLCMVIEKIEEETRISVEMDYVH